ncbi:MAG: hypothetical protein K6A14_08280 [Erysipelotrichaceae bacterium]|nr:hypothetical protein [Erysipelotrichaceae bacterium]
MAYKSIMDGIIFIEGEMKDARLLEPIKYVKDSFYNQQLKNLNDIKRQLVSKAKDMGANAVVDFKYGQKSTTMLRSMLLALDDNINWYAEGIAAILDEETYNALVTKLTRRDEDDD